MSLSVHPAGVLRPSDQGGRVPPVARAVHTGRRECRPVRQPAQPSCGSQASGNALQDRGQVLRTERGVGDIPVSCGNVPRRPGPPDLSTGKGGHTGQDTGRD